MLLLDPQFARSDVLRIFNHAQVYLFVGALTITIGLLAAAFALLRRRFDPLLLWFALFAFLYGLRLEMNYQLLWALGLRPVVFRRIVIAVGYLIPIPAFFFFRIMNPLWRGGRLISIIAWPIFLGTALATLIVGDHSAFRYLNNIGVTAALLVIVFELVRVRSDGSGRPEQTAGPSTALDAQARPTSLRRTASRPARRAARSLPA